MTVPGASEEQGLQDVVLPDNVEGFTKRRVELVQRAVKEWTSALIDLGGRNNLLRYRDLRQGTLDLTDAAPRAVAALLQGKAIKVSSLFPNEEVRDRNLRRVRTVSNKAKENFEERGLETLSLACGLATWDNQRVAAWEPAAPVLLRQASLRSLGAAQDEFELALVDEMEVNPTLLHFLKVNFECEFDQERLLDRVDGVIDEPWELQAAYDWIGEQTHRVPGFSVEPRVVLANFAYAKLPMVKDLENAFDELVAHDLVAAIAGDEEARDAVRAAVPNSVLAPDSTPLADEFLVLDADSSQNYAINAVIAGESLIMRGPPGTGKSQTISNLIASLMARNKRVLFVAEKRAAIDAVLKRLHQKQLGDLVLDLHGGVGSRRAFAQAVAHALAASRRAPRVDHAAQQRRVEKRREELNQYERALHDRRAPWDISIYELRGELLGLELAHNEVRFRGEILAGLDRSAEALIEEDLSHYARLGGLTLGSSGSPWAQAHIVSDDEVQRANELVEQLRRHTLPVALQGLHQASDQTNLPRAQTVGEWQERIELWSDIAETLDTCGPSIYELDLETVVERMAPAATGAFARFKAKLTSGEYKQARRDLRAVILSGKTADAELLRRAENALNQRARWRQLGGTGPLFAPSNLNALEGPYNELIEQLQRLKELIQSDNLGGKDPHVLRELLDQLISDRGTLMTLPELHRVEASLKAAGIGEFLSQMQTRQVSEEFAIQSFRYAWLRSILDHLGLADRLVEGFVPEQHEKSIDDFKAGDREHIETTASRIRRICAEQAVQVRDELKDQEAILQKQAALKRRHMPVRDLVRNTSDVLLALKPCWAMSPLVVSQLMPAKTYFDVVIFDEASQITPADAAPAIFRGRQLVVAGDEKQLPPTAFFVSESPEDGTDDEELESSELAAIAGFESILDALGVLLKFRMLRWHYRSRDERLIAFSNAHIYDRQLITFPGVGGDEVLRRVLAPHDPAADTNSPSPEVETVVNLVFEHALERPDESLGVIAMGIKHANRIEESLRQRLREDPELESELGNFFAEDLEERFFVKNLERVQGDERDAIILSVGYGKDARGGVPLRWGPILGEGGERRLNVAVTRAKNRITLVSSFGVRDIDPERSDKEGFLFLRQYMQYIESGGENLGDTLLEKPELNPFEIDVRDTLTRHGLKLVAQYGSSGYWIDYAVMHPTQPGRYILALECDGATYHSSESARDRDRLRQEQLERLGWRFHRIWSGEWFNNKEHCLERVLAAYENAVKAAVDTDEEAEREAPAQAPLRLTVESLPNRRNGSRPPLRRRQPIDYYTPADLVRLIRWIESDDQLRTEDELLEETIKELGYARRGHRIVGAITAAIRQARRGP